MSRFRITPAALADLTDIRDYLRGTAGPDVAARVLSDLYDAMVNVASRPDLGHARPDLTTEPLLFFLVFRYLVIYRTDRPILEVVRVLHSARNVAAIVSGI